MTRLHGERINEFGNWAVTTYGLEFIPESFAIERERLNQDWEAVIEYKKTEFQLGFSEAIDFARQYHSITVDAVRGAN